MPGWSPSTTSRSRCTTRTCCHGCCSTRRCSMCRKRRRSTSPIQAASCAVRSLKTPTALSALRSTQVEARVDIHRARHTRLKDNNILYARDDNGEYLQLYTTSFKDLFFLEVVARQGYKGFGAINAPIRLNAQARLAGESAASAL